MSITETRWKAGQVRLENGVFFGADEFVELCGSPSHGYRADFRTPAIGLFKAEPHRWTLLEHSCCTLTAQWRVVGGGTACEGGFVALEESSTGRLQWLLHLNDAEPFTAVQIKGSQILAVSGHDSTTWLQWHIPLDAPEELKCRSFREGEPGKLPN